MNGDFPALLDLAENRLYPLHGAMNFTVGRNQKAGLCIMDVGCSRQQFQLLLQGSSYFVEHQSLTSQTLLDGKPLGPTPTPLHHGNTLQVGSRLLRFLERPITGAPPPAAHKPPTGPGPRLAAPPAVPGDGTVMMGHDPGAAPLPLVAQSFVLNQDQIIGRERGQVQIPLPHPHVSRRHARIWRRGPQLLINDEHSANGTFVNGTRLSGPRILQVNDRIDIGPFSFVFNGKALVSEVSRDDNIELVGRRLCRSGKDERGNARILLDNISVVIRPTEFACILGPSGAGKSTLLSALSARYPADRGMVLVNNKDLYGNFQALKQDLVLVPQQVVIHESLTVEQALWYTAKFRLPPDTEREELAGHINRMLDTVGMQAHRSKLIKILSGGQQKRVALANELISQPSLLFLDEVTSGLDEQTDREMMALFRQLADKGKTVVCITHSLANVEESCNLLIVLGAGGRVAFVGTPKEALSYFHISRLGDIYDKIGARDAKESERKAIEWQKKFHDRANPQYQTYVLERLPPESGGGSAAVPVQPKRLSERFGEFFRQCVLLLLRNVRLMSRDKTTLLALLVQAGLIGLLLGLVFGKLPKADEMEIPGRTLNLLFLLQISCFWFGCNNAAKEIVKERHIYSRERDFNLQLLSYYGSKLLLLGTITAFQVVLLWSGIAYYCEPAGNAVHQGLFLVGLGVTGVTLGLLVSALATTQDLAVTLVPIVLVPQIILANVICSLKDVGKLLGQWLITCYWSNRGLFGLLPENTRHRVPGIGTDDQDPSVTQAALVLAAHALACILAAVVVMWLQDRQQGLRRAMTAWLSLPLRKK